LRARIAACLALTTVLATTLAASSHAATGGGAIATAHAALDTQAAKLPWNTGATRVVPGRLVVVWRHGAPTAATRALSANVGATTTAAPSTDIDVVQLPAGASETAAIHRYERSPLVRSAEPDRIASVMALPNDSHFTQQWALNNTGQAHEETDQGLGPGLTQHGTADADVDGPEAWAAVSSPTPTVVAVIDTGVAITHPDLQNSLWSNTAEQSGTPGVDDDNNGFVDDLHGWDFANHDKNPSPGKGLENSHGTHVAGIVAAEQNNSRGISGVCPPPDCQIMALRFGSASGLSLGKEIAAIHYAVANGAKVINLSIGSPVWSPAERTAIQQAGHHGVLVVAAAGNAGEDNDIAFYPDLRNQAWAPSYPASYSLSNILSVAASNDRDRYAYFSQCKDADVPLWRCGFSSFGHDSVDVAAPGVDILSTVKVGVGHAFADYEFFDGTSMASPMTAGIAGLVLSQNPGDTPVQAKNAVMNGVDHPSALKLLTMWGKATGVGKSPLSGHFTRTQGRVNALGALANDTTSATPKTDGNIDGARSIVTRRTGTVSWPSDDNDVYKRRLVKGHKYSVTLDGPRGRDFDLWIWNPGTKDIFQFTAGCFRRGGSCPAIASASTGRSADEHTTFRAHKTGTFYIQVNSWYSHGRYSLRIKKA
jgi:subtilisin family serine protease